MRQATIVTVPGWAGSGPGHWQSIWERDHPEYRRAEMGNWQNVDRSDWVRAVERTLAEVAGEAVLVAHSLGCLAVVWWAIQKRNPAGQVRGALLVAPPNLDSSGCLLPALASFAPAPSARLPFPSLLIASENDPYASFAEAGAMAQAWGSELHNEGSAGHINATSGHGPWPEGQQHLNRFLASLTRKQALIA
jgi:predicted alpha/beta hydrolase family esterase